MQGELQEVNGRKVKSHDTGVTLVGSDISKEMKKKRRQFFRRTSIGGNEPERRMGGIKGGKD